MSVRYRLHGDPLPFTEGVGVVQSITPDVTGAPTVKLMDRRGDTKMVPVVDVVAAKVF